MARTDVASGAYVKYTQNTVRLASASAPPKTVDGPTRNGKDARGSTTLRVRTAASGASALVASRSTGGEFVAPDCNIRSHSPTFPKGSNACHRRTEAGFGFFLCGASTPNNKAGTGSLSFHASVVAAAS